MVWVLFVPQPLNQPFTSRIHRFTHTYTCFFPRSLISKFIRSFIHSFIRVCVVLAVLLPYQAESSLRVPAIPSSDRFLFAVPDPEPSAAAHRCYTSDYLGSTPRPVDAAFVGAYKKATAPALAPAAAPPPAGPSVRGTNDSGYGGGGVVCLPPCQKSVTPVPA